MSKLKPYPFWTKGGTPENIKLPKMFRVKNDVLTRVLKSIVINRKTGKFEEKTSENSKPKE